MADKYPQGAELKTDADKVTATFSKCEKICFDAGGRLGDAIPGLGELGDLFSALSHSLESAEFRAASLDLQAVATDISTIGYELTAESQGLMHLVDLNKRITAQIENVSASIRTITALVFNVKIEAASFTATADNMTGFADGLQFLAIKAQRAVDEYKTTHAKLYELLQNTCQTQMDFQKSHQDRLLSVTSEIAASLDVIARRRREIAGSLTDMGEQSQRIGARIGQAVVALQIGDSTRQRIEHVHTALHLAAEVLDLGRSPEPSNEVNHPEIAGHESSVAAAICHLQSMQLNAALSDFDAEMNTIACLLQGLVDESESLAARGAALFGSNEKGADSFLEELERKLEGANILVEQSYHARTIVDRAASSIASTMADMDGQTARLSEIVVDMTMLGMNAVLKSTRLGQQGKGLNVIALELRNYAVEVVQGIKVLKPAIDEVMKFIAHYSEAGRSGTAGQMLQLGGRMTAAIEIFRSSGARMLEASSRLQKESETVCRLLKSAVSQLSSSNDISETLLQAVASIDRFASSIDDAHDIDDPQADYIYRMLFHNYTMMSEREIHQALIPSSISGADFVVSPAVSAAEVQVEEFLF